MTHRATSLWPRRLLAATLGLIMASSAVPAHAADAGSSPIPTPASASTTVDQAALRSTLTTIQRENPGWHADAAAAGMVAVPATTPLPNKPVSSISSTRAALRTNGPLAIKTLHVPSKQTPKGMGEALFAYPADKVPAPRPTVLMIAGWGSEFKTLQWLGQRLATHGYVAVMIHPPIKLDWPPRRATALKVAAQWMSTSSPIAQRIDPKRVALYGYSMGGGAVLRASTMIPGLKAVVSVYPWDTKVDFPENRVPTVLMSSADDPTAPPRKFSDFMYASITKAPKSYVEVPTGGHHAPSSTNPHVSETTLIWLGRHLLGDRRYSSLICPGPGQAEGYSTYGATCPM
ncbi:dienelactone hydrolase family protein [Austwickia chelonae]|uniref:dienelactone hydrolase family protein n=1 Tax=Austwickia chelonae TaxID=100225 RepID=UPI000E239FEC|nr:dienelactone hydrolase family protein [Austwickia chelonae]